MREVDDAVRQDQLRSFWRRYGLWIAGLLVLGLLAFAAWLYWDHRSSRVSAEVSEEIAKVLDVVAVGGAPDAKAVDALSQADQPGYRAAALLAKGAAAADKGDMKGAIAVYRAMAADRKLDQPYRDLALIKQTSAEFDQLKPEDIVARLKPLAVAGNPWFGSAGEMVAIAYMKMRKPELAGPIFAAVAKDQGVPSTVRSRARQMAGLLGVDAVETEELGGDQSGNGGNNGE